VNFVPTGYILTQTVCCNPVIRYRPISKIWPVSTEYWWSLLPIQLVNINNTTIYKTLLGVTTRHLAIFMHASAVMSVVGNCRKLGTGNFGNSWK